LRSVSRAQAGCGTAPGAVQDRRKKASILPASDPADDRTPQTGGHSSWPHPLRHSMNF